MKIKQFLPPEAINFYKKCGKKGGSSTSQNKAEASRKNGLAPCRPGKIRGRPFGTFKKPKNEAL